MLEFQSFPIRAYQTVDLTIIINWPVNMEQTVLTTANGVSLTEETKPQKILLSPAPTTTGTTLPQEN